MYIKQYKNWLVNLNNFTLEVFLIVCYILSCGAKVSRKSNGFFNIQSKNTL